VWFTVTGLDENFMKTFKHFEIYEAQDTLITGGAADNDNSK